MAAITPQNPFDAVVQDAIPQNEPEIVVSEKPPAAASSANVLAGAQPPPMTSTTLNQEQTMPATIPSQVNPTVSNESPVKPAAVTASRNNKLPPMTPPSQQRNNNNHGGLSELSKQLRALQAKNKGQAVEIDRLQRQLRILADLQGISVANLQKALDDACQSEAYSELQSRVAALRAQLEAASLAKQKSVEEDAAAHQLATLQLRVGELEEVELDLRAQINGLYGSLKEQTAKASRFESTCKQQVLEIKRLKQELQNAQQAQQQQVAPLVPAPPSGMVPAVTRDVATAPTPQVSQQQQQIVPAPASAIVASPADMELLAETARLAKVEAQVQQDKLTISEKQLEATEQQHKLRQAQFKARSMVQEERIQDLEQQLNSLYVAFEMLRQEHSEGEATRAALQTSLNEADSRVAQQVNASDFADSSPRVEAVAVPASPDYTTASPPSPLPQTPTYFAASPIMPVPVSRQSITSQSSHLTPISHHASIASASPPVGGGDDDIIMSGILLVKSSSILRAWKKKHVTLYQNHSDFELVISDAQQVKEDKSYVLEVGVSTLHNYATHRYAFIIRVDPYDKDAPVIFAAATSEKDYIQWMSALKTATTGDEYNPNDYNVGFGESHMLPASSSVEDQEAKDLEAALRLSTQEM